MSLHWIRDFLNLGNQGGESQVSDQSSGMGHQGGGVRSTYLGEKKKKKRDWLPFKHKSFGEERHKQEQELGKSSQGVDVLGKGHFFKYLVLTVEKMNQRCGRTL